MASSYFRLPDFRPAKVELFLTVCIQPVTTRDFMNYLLYVERSAENLQFYLWFQDYQDRFFRAQTSDVLLAPEWIREMAAQAEAKIRKDAAAKHNLAGAVGVPHGEVLVSRGTPSRTPPRSATSDVDFGALETPLRFHAAHVFHAAGTRVPFTIQPFREEITRIIATYLAPSSPRQLNLSAAQLKHTLHALSYTTHPSALLPALHAVDVSLRHQAHPNFIRWSSLLLAGLALALTLGSSPRGTRALALVPWVLGAATLFAARRGMCVVLHGLHHRHIRPWELFVPSSASACASSCSSSSSVGVVEEGKVQSCTASFDSFGPSNSYEDEPWVKKYDGRNAVRKIFDRRVWIQEPALRQIQDTIFLQKMLVSLASGGVLTAIFVAVPTGRLY
ncbi:hypothetical protein ESCO_003222 [Escovopsis weberi]|uniref:RGS domain-containing protein n=1 Tax=Escovopsis weberi TaxID=150374 RepID=A0A0M8N240_ESCWE|nr:hypothetical protein ESCO_003222 [Escovopsis weberi]